jgi:hypothetical protein
MPAIDSVRIHAFGVGYRRSSGRDVGKRLVGEPDAVLPLEQPSRAAADGRILGLDELDAGILQRFEKPFRSQ